MIKALAVPASQNLQPLSQYLRAQKVLHRISEQGENQVVWVANPSDTALVQSSYERLRQGALDVGALRQELPPYWQTEPSSHLWQYIKAAPLVSLLVMSSALITLLNEWSGQALFMALRIGSPAYVLESGEVWRLITPIFLHFNLMHLVFNMLMLWVFGVKIELRGERLLLLSLVVGSAIFSNVAQYYVSGSGFGGMSGVVYAILAYCWLWDRLQPTRAYGFPAALMGLMMFWLALGYTDLLHWAGFGSMANTAHLSGLVFGFLFAGSVNALRGFKQP
ncbi:MAG: rhomboid family intramembrane serine protease [Pseudomonadales bacterium]|nr:rhomboid family intramembrane serine protease [Pseudomonadales bacterium]